MDRMKGEKAAETNDKSSIIRAGKLAHTQPKTQTESAACWEPDIREWRGGGGYTFMYARHVFSRF